MRLKLSVFALTTIILAACSGKLPQKVEYPRYAFRNINSQELVSVERTDKATILSFKSFYTPHHWIRVSKGAFLTDGEKRYAMIGTEGITPDEKLYMDDNGNAEYKLFFEPIPSKTRRCIFVHHRVHTTWRDAEEQTRTTEFLEVTEVTMPVGLGNDGHPIAVGFEYPTDDGCAKRRMIHIGITREQDYIHVIPSPQFHLLLCGREEIGQAVFFHPSSLGAFFSSHETNN